MSIHCSTLKLLAATTTLLAAAVTLGARASQQPLTFDPARYTIVHVTLDGAPIEVRRYQVVYVAKPIAMSAEAPARGGGPRGGGPGPAAPFDPFAYQTMFVYVPQSAYADARTAIVLQVNNGGWFASAATDRIVEGGTLVSTSDTDNTGAALKAGYVVVSAGTRSRGIKAADGRWAGKAPAVIVDAKAAVRYLRFNDALMPGSAERIVITGTSGGGALSVAVAASGNSPDYYPYLAEIGAAGMDGAGRSTIRDDVFATVAYCPITDLGHADMAYEWQFNAVRTAANTTRGQYPDDMQRASKDLSAAYPAYLASLRLKREDGSALTAASMQTAILAEVQKSVESAIARGETIPALGQEFSLPGGRGGVTALKNDWLTVEAGRVKNIDYANYLRFVTNATALKTAPAFDASANTGNPGVSGENTLFGPASVEYANFSEFSWNQNDVAGDATGKDDTGQTWAAYVAGPGRTLVKQIEMASPMSYLNSAADTAPYWYVRHGMVDRDTSFAVELALYYAIRGDGSVKDVNFKLAWLRGHSGNYDVREAYAWLAGALTKAGAPAAPARR